MGHKVHPIGFRLGILYPWQSKWFADKNYTELLHEDLSMRRLILKKLSDAAVSRVELERNANQVIVTIHTAKPGIVIGRGGQKVDELRTELEKMTGRRVRVNIIEIRQPELDAYLVARSVADQLERRVAFRRAMKQAVTRTMQRGARGVKVQVAGRLGGAEMSRRETEKDGRVPLHTLRADVDFGQAEAATTFGRIGVKAWIYRGDILPERRLSPEADAAIESPPVAPVAAAAVAAPAAAAAPVAVAEAPVAPPVVAEAPVKETPVVEAPVAEASVAKPPVAPTAETPAAATVDEAPAEAAVAEAPAEAPVAEAPETEAPVETPVPETPVESAEAPSATEREA
ncbi:MAG: 30S ribosomal protein S3 [Dehalococcoidia bacterium]|nr:30S ribosomal protein S3 [Dehalococcoidia bacterium]